MKIELLGGTTKEELEQRIQIVASAGKLSRFPGNVFEVIEASNDYEKNLRMIKRIINMGHKSIIEHDYLVFAICDVTPIIEQTIIGNRLTSFTIKSRREVDFRTAGYYVPTFRDKDGNVHKDNEKLQGKYKEHMQYLFDTYGFIKDSEIPAEDSRFILPYCFHSNIIMGLDARELERMVESFTKGPLSKISEIKEFGENLYDIAKEYIPFLIDEIEKVEENTEDPFAFFDSVIKKPEIEILPKTELVSYTENADEIVILSSIMYHYQCQMTQAKKILKELKDKDKDIEDKFIDIIMHKKESRELEQVSYTFQIPIALSILTHITRHRMHSLLIPEFIPMWDMNNYVVPETIKAKPEVLKKYLEAIKKNMEVYNEFKDDVMEEDLIYFYVGAQMLNIETTMNARNLQWICRMRCCNKTQWLIRAIAKDIAKEVREVSPLIGKHLGPTCITDGFCNEGKESCGLIDKIIEAKTLIKK